MPPPSSPSPKAPPLVLPAIHPVDAASPSHQGRTPPHTPAHISFSLPQVTGHEGPSSQPRPPSSPPQGLTPAAPPPLDCPACLQTPSGVPRLLKQNPPSTTHSTRCSCGLVSLPHSTVSTRCLHFLLPPTPPLHQGQGQRHHTGHSSLFSGLSWPPLYAQHPQPLLSSQDPQTSHPRLLAGPPSQPPCCLPSSLIYTLSLGFHISSTHSKTLMIPRLHLQPLASSEHLLPQAHSLLSSPNSVCAELSF